MAAAVNGNTLSIKGAGKNTLTSTYSRQRVALWELCSYFVVHWAVVIYLMGASLSWANEEMFRDVFHVKPCGEARDRLGGSTGELVGETVFIACPLVSTILTTVFKLNSTRRRHEQALVFK